MIMRAQTLVKRVEQLKGINIIIRSPIECCVEEEDLDFLVALIEFEIKHCIEIPDAFLEDLSITWIDFVKKLSRLPKIPKAERNEFVRCKNELLDEIKTASDSGGEKDEGFDALHLALEQAKRDGDPSRISNACNALGSAFLHEGQSEKALECFRESLALLEASGDPLRLMAAKCHLGMVLRRGGALDTAEMYCSQSLELAIELAALSPENEEHVSEETLQTISFGKSFVGESLRNLGYIKVLQGRFQEAVAIYENLLEISEQIQSPLWMSEAILLLAQLVPELAGEEPQNTEENLCELLKFFEEAQYNKDLEAEAVNLLQQYLDSTDRTKE